MDFAGEFLRQLGAEEMPHWCQRGLRWYRSAQALGALWSCCAPQDPLDPSKLKDVKARKSKGIEAPNHRLNHQPTKSNGLVLSSIAGPKFEFAF